MKSAIRTIVFAIATIIVMSVALFVAIPQALEWLLATLSMCNDRHVIQNEYVNADFKNWHTVEVEGFRAFNLPQEWNLELTETGYQITDPNGTILAHGASLDADDSIYKDYESFLSSVSASDISDVKMQPIQKFVYMEGSDLYFAEASGADESSSYYILCLGRNPSLQFAFRSTFEEDELLDITQAIAYSYTYSEELHLHGQPASMGR